MYLQCNNNYICKFRMEVFSKLNIAFIFLYFSYLCAIFNSESYLILLFI